MRRHGSLVFAVAVLAACGTRGQRAPAEAGSPCVADPLSATGDATFYEPAGSAPASGSCSFEPTPGDPMVAALNAPDYAHAAWCGACLAVSGPLGEVVVRVVDVCPGCKHGDLDLSREAFARLAPLSAGRVRVAWREVECPVSGPIAYQLKTGSSAHWIAFQVRNHRYAIAKLEARSARGAYEAISRADYNYFVASKGLGAGPFALRVTDVHGQVLDDAAITLGAGVARAGAAQFPACP